MRADASRNSARLLVAARDVFVERGPDAPLEEIARRAGVGIATLYRRFGDRANLTRTVVLTALTATVEQGEEAGRDHADPMAALGRYVHAVLDLRTSAVIPTLLGELDLEEPELKAARDRAARTAQKLIDAAHRTGDLRKDVTFADVGLMLVRLSRPLPGPLPDDVQLELAHRHAELFLAGLRATATDEPLPGPALERSDLHDPPNRRVP